MLHHNALFNWSFPFGRLAGVTLRMSWLMPVALIWLTFRLGLPSAVLTWCILFFSILLHEFGHIFSARAFGLNADQILLWPLGGLAEIERTDDSRSNFWVAAFGPIVNLLIAIPASYFALSGPDGMRWTQLLNPFDITVHSDIVHRGLPINELMQIVFSINWLLLTVNLIPATPLDGGRMLRSILESRMARRKARELSFRVSIGAGITLFLAGMFFTSSPMLMGFGTFILIGALLEWVQMKLIEPQQEGYMGYDFSAGYTSLGDPDELEPVAAENQKGFIERWKEKRANAKRLKEETEQQIAEESLDQLLEKVHSHGMSSLTSAEKRMLERVSKKLRDKSNSNLTS